MIKSRFGLANNLIKKNVLVKPIIFPLFSHYIFPLLTPLLTPHFIHLKRIVTSIPNIFPCNSHYMPMMFPKYISSRFPLYCIPMNTVASTKFLIFTAKNHQTGPHHCLSNGQTIRCHRKFRVLQDRFRRGLCWISKTPWL